MAKRAIGRPEEQFLRELNICQNLGGINFGEARWRVAGRGREQQAGRARALGEIVRHCARGGSAMERHPEDAFNVLEALGVLNAQLERLSVGLGRMSDDELATLVQRTLIAAPAIPQSIPDRRPAMRRCVRGTI
jgi:hypothetical protein